MFASYTETLQLLNQLFCDRLDIDIQVTLEEVSNLRIFVIAMEAFGACRVNIHIDGRMTMSRPPNLSSSTDHIGKVIDAALGSFQEELKLFVTGIHDSEAVLDKLTDILTNIIFVVGDVGVQSMS